MNKRVCKYLISILISLCAILPAAAETVPAGVQDRFQADVVYPDAEKWMPVFDEDKLPPDPGKNTELKLGDTIILGSYEQDNDPENGAEPVEWQIFYISHDGLSIEAICKIVPNELKDLEGRAAEKWLENDFFDSVFDESVRSGFREQTTPEISLLEEKQFRYLESRFKKYGIDTAQWELRPVIRLDTNLYQMISGGLNFPPVPSVTPGGTISVTEEPSGTPSGTVSETQEPNVNETQNISSTQSAEIEETPEVAMTKENPGVKETKVPDIKDDDSGFKPVFLVVLCVVAAAACVGVPLMGRRKMGKDTVSKKDLPDKREPKPVPVPAADTGSETVVLERSRIYLCSGCKGQGKRDYQEDSLWYSSSASRGAPICAVVVDGMGGMDNGAESSEIAISVFEKHFSSIRTDQDIPSKLWKISKEANDIIYQTNSAKDMNGGSTLISVFIADDLLYWISIGDSRIYLFRDGILAPINEEHELENRMYNGMLNGDIELIDVREMPNRELRKLTSNLGRSSIPLIDQNFIPYRLKYGDKLLLCSDGVSGTLSEKELINCLEDPDTDKNCDLIAQMVMAKGKKGQDNYSAIVVAVAEETRK